jgi:hypothetical protein
VDKTEIQVDRTTGRLAGYKQESVTLEVEKILHVTSEPEAGDLFGTSRAETTRKVYSWWNDANMGAARYDSKVAGVFIVVHYPPGVGINASGQAVSNFELAQKIAADIAAGRPCVMPKIVGTDADDDQINNPESQAWRVELLEDKGSRQPGFSDRLRYLDSLKMRAWRRPERSATEGQSGTKAEAEAHADLGVIDGELIHANIARHINWYVIDQLLALNFGPSARGSVYITPAPLTDRKTALLREVMRQLMASPTGLEELLTWLDWDAIVDTLGLPKAAEVVGQIGGMAEMRGLAGVDATGPEAERMRQLYADMQRDSGDPNAPPKGNAVSVPGAPAGQNQSDAVASNDLRATVGGSAAILALQRSYYAREIPRDAAVANAELVFGFSAVEAATLFPEAPPDAPEDPEAAAREEARTAALKQGQRQQSPPPADPGNDDTPGRD